MERTTKHFRKREAILACLRQTKVHPSAEWVYAQLKPEFPDLSLGTVYRNLALFKEQGLIQSVGTVSGVERFDGDIRPHAHHICTRCGCVGDLQDVTMLEELRRMVAKYADGTVDSCQLTFTGLCRSCAEAEQSA